MIELNVDHIFDGLQIEAKLSADHPDKSNLDRLVDDAVPDLVSQVKDENSTIVVVVNKGGGKVRVEVGKNKEWNLGDLITMAIHQLAQLIYPFWPR